MGEMEQKLKADMDVVKGMLAIHSVITRGLHVTLENSRRFMGEGPGNDRGGFSDYAHSLSSLLHAHHLSEDKTVFPSLQPILPGAPFAKLSADHKVIERQIDAQSIGLAAGDDGSLGPMADAVATLDELWHPHIEIEQTWITLENIGDKMTPEDHLAVVQRSSQDVQENSGPPELIMPFVLYNMEPEARARFASVLPPTLTEQLIPGPWKERWKPMQPFLLPTE